MDFSSFKALTFDCYGTLIDWEKGMSDIVRPWLDEMRSAVTPEAILTTYAVMKWRHEQPRPIILFTDLMHRCWEDLEGAFDFPSRPDRVEEFAASIGRWPPFSDTVESLKHLAQHYKLGILSNIDNVPMERSKTLLEVPFAVTVTSEDVGSYKPDLAHFDAAFRRFEAQGIARHEILHVAQSQYHDIAPANAIGLPSVRINRRHDKRGAGATIKSDAVAPMTVTSLAELVALQRTAMTETT